MQLLRMGLVLGGLWLSATACKTSSRSHGSTASGREPASNENSVNPMSRDSNFVVPKESFPHHVREILVTRHDAERDRLKELTAGGCVKTESFLKRLMTRLVSGSRLESAVNQAPPMLVALNCSSRGIQLPETRAGIIWVHPEILKAFKTEDQVAALLAHELVHYTRSHEEELEDIQSNWMPFRENAVNRARWDQEKEADRLSVRLLANAAFDPYAATELPLIVDKFLAAETNWQEGKVNFPFDASLDRSMRAQVELKDRRLARSPQTPGELSQVLDELAHRS